MTYLGALGIQALMALTSLPWLACYWAAFRIDPRGPSRQIDLLYNLGVLANVTWAVMALAPQPRFPGLLSWSELTWGSSPPLILGAALVARFTSLNMAVLRANTSAVQRRYAQPQTLLTSGQYASVRNPMNSGGMLIWLGLCLLTGASLTILLFPFYFLVNHTFTMIEERLALRPVFGEVFARYRARVPGYFAQSHLRWLAAVLLATVGQWVWLAPT